MSTAGNGGIHTIRFKGMIPEELFYDHALPNIAGAVDQYVLRPHPSG
jgi:hypothetical protein